MYEDLRAEWKRNQADFNVPDTIGRSIISIMVSGAKAACDVKSKKHEDLEEPGSGAQSFFALIEMLTGCFR